MHNKGATLTPKVKSCASLDNIDLYLHRGLHLNLKIYFMCTFRKTYSPLSPDQPQEKSDHLMPTNRTKKWLQNQQSTILYFVTPS